MFMKLLCSFLMLLLIKNSIAQENIFIGKIEYIKETKLLSGEFVPKGNAESVTFFNTTSYAFVLNMKIDIDGAADRLMKKSMPNEIAGDSFEIARQTESIKKQLEAQLIRTATAKTFINFTNNVAQKPKTIDNESYCVIDTLPKINWQLKEDTITIEGLLCQKARGFFIDKYYSVWFAPSIPFAAGPLNMHGLPGIIVLATSEDEKTRYRMKSLTYPLLSTVKMISCNGEKQISPTQFMLLQSKKREAFLQNMEDIKNKNDKK
jgi:GLPGLI family protein